MNLVAQYRKSADLTLGEASSRTGIAEFELRWLERGGVPRVDDLIRLSTFFNCQFEALFPDVGPYSNVIRSIAQCKLSTEERSKLGLTAFDPDPRYWFLCVRFAGMWHGFYVRSATLWAFDSVINADRDSYFALETCGQQVVLNCKHIEAYKFVWRSDLKLVKFDDFREYELGILFLGAKVLETVRFPNAEQIAQVFESIEFCAPGADPFIEFEYEAGRLCLASDQVGLIQTAMSKEPATE